MIGKHGMMDDRDILAMIVFFTFLVLLAQEVTTLAENPVNCAIIVMSA